MAQPKIVVIGGGLAGLMAAIRAAENGAAVEVYSLTPPKRSHSATAQGGINGAIDTKGEGDSPQKHFEETIYGGDFLANQPPVKGFCDAAPSLIYMFDRMGVMFNRTAEGLIDLRRAGGTKYSRVAFAGGTTGQQMMYALDEQVRKLEALGQAKVYYPFDFLSAVIDGSGRCRGAVVEDTWRMQVKAVEADAVIVATGGIGYLFGRSTNGTVNTGSAQSALYQQGAWYANGEFIQIHPTAIPGEDKNRLISETCRGEGGRVWVYRDGKPWYFLEEWYPSYGNLVPRDIATRAIFKVCVEMGLGIDGKNQVYLDLTHLDPHQLEVRLSGILDIYRTFAGEDPARVPMKIFPAVHFTMGGLWVDYNHMTNIPGLFAAGECDYQYHGANRLGGNGMPACVYAGMVAGKAAVEYAEGLGETGRENAGPALEAEARRQEEIEEDLRRRDGPENPYRLHQELGEWMVNNVTVVRYNDRLRETDNKILELMERYRRIGLADRGGWTNQSLVFARQLGHMLQLARVITLGALRRDESRGAHYKPEFPDRDDANWLKTTIASFTPEGPQFSYEPVDIRYLEPRPRRYD